MIIKKSPPGPTNQDHRVPFFSILVRGGQAPWCHRVVTINLACEEWFPIVIGILRFQPVFLSSLFSSVLKNHISHFIFATRTWSHSTAVSKLQLLYSSLFFLDVLLQRSWPGADTWSILRAAPLNVNSFYLPLVERQHSEVEVAYNIKENPPGSGILLSRVSRGIWSEELTVLQTHTHTHRVQLSYSCFTAYPDLLEQSWICWKHQPPWSDGTGERASQSTEENRQKNLPKRIWKSKHMVIYINL